MKMLNYVMLFLIAIVISGCGPIYSTKYEYIPPHSTGGRMCANDCLEAKSHCQQMAQMREDACRDRAHRAALLEFKAYQEQKKNLGKKVRKTVADFDRGNECSRSTDCDENYKMCFQTCGGTIQANKECIAFCDKQ